MPPIPDSRVLFEALVEPCQRRLWTFIRRMVGDRERAEDLYQETLLQAWRALPNYRETGRFLSWLFRIAHNQVRNAARHDAARPTLVTSSELPERSGGSGPHQDLVAREVSRRLRAALTRLTPEQREVFLLRAHSDMSFREIARLTDAPLSTVINRMRDSLKKLAAETEDDR